MVVASLANETIQAQDDLPIIDLSGKRSEIPKLLVKACEQYGFFKVINHGVPENIITKMEEESFNFFHRPVAEKLMAGPATPLGYGRKNIGFNGDFGAIEYLLFSTNPESISEMSQTISNDPEKFRVAVVEVIEALEKLACEILEMLAEGLCMTDQSVFSKLIRKGDSDSLFRLNHYPPTFKDKDTSSPSLGFGEHSDPQILTVLRSNDVGGLQISPQPGVWVPVSPDPTSFCVNVGDLLQVMTNGRFASVRHRAIINSAKARLSMAYFGGPSLNTLITPLSEMVTPNTPSLYNPFLWNDYKKAAYSLRLGQTRIDLFKSGHKESTVQHCSHC